MYSIPQEVAHDFFQKEKSIYSQQSASGSSLGQVLGLERSFPRSDFLIEHYLSVLRDPNYQRSKRCFFMLLIELILGNLTQAESGALLVNYF